MSRDFKDEAIPTPDAQATAEEEARAKRFAELVERVQSGQGLPPALDIEDRELLEMTGIISASAHARELPAKRVSSIVDDAMRQAIGLGVAGSASSLSGAEDELSGRRKRKTAGIASVVVLAAAAAAALLLYFRADTSTEPSGPSMVTAQSTESSAQLSTIHVSRPADDLVGEIAREQSGNARERIDRIYADRMTGFRDLHLQRIGGTLGGSR